MGKDFNLRLANLADWKSDKIPAPPERRINVRHDTSISTGGTASAQPGKGSWFRPHQALGQESAAAVLTSVSQEFNR